MYILRDWAHDLPDSDDAECQCCGALYSGEQARAMDGKCPDCDEYLERV